MSNIYMHLDNACRIFNEVWNNDKMLAAFIQKCHHGTTTNSKKDFYIQKNLFQWNIWENVCFKPSPKSKFTLLTFTITKINKDEEDNGDNDNNSCKDPSNNGSNFRRFSIILWNWKIKLCTWIIILTCTYSI